MNCDTVQPWLLQVESLQVKDWPRDVNHHLKVCAACAKVARGLFKLEEAWRDQPLPAECRQAKKAFLKKLSEQASPQPIHQPMLDEPKPKEREKPSRSERRARAKASKRGWRPIRWVAIAAMLLIAVFTGLLFTPRPGRAAQPDIVDRLIDFNVAMTESDSKERKELLEKYERELRRDLAKAKSSLTAEEHKLAEELLEVGCWLAINDDPIAEAGKITDIADKLADRAVAAEGMGTDKDKERCAICYDKFYHYGVNPMQKGTAPMFKKFRALQFKKVGPEKGGDDKGKADKGGPENVPFDNAEWERWKLQNNVGIDPVIWARWMEQQRQLQFIWMRSPEYARPDMHMRFQGCYQKSFGGGMPRHGFHR